MISPNNMTIIIFVLIASEFIRHFIHQNFYQSGIECLLLMAVNYRGNGQGSS
jgi:hypothetical protein